MGAPVPTFNPPLWPELQWPDLSCDRLELFKTTRQNRGLFVLFDDPTPVVPRCGYCGCLAGSFEATRCTVGCGAPL